MLSFSRNAKQLAKHVNIDLKLLSHWLNANMIALITSKTEYIILNTILEKSTLIHVSNLMGKRCSAIKNLGIHIDKNLDWSFTRRRTIK